MDKRKCILIIEDEEEIREGIRLLLGSEEFAFREASNGEEGLSLLDAHTDLVILDVMMPGLHGIQVCQKIREHCNVPILFLTAKAQESDMLIGLQAGGDDYLTKPFSYMELMSRVRALLRRYHIYRGRNENGTSHTDSYIELNGIRISRERNEVLRNGQEVNLTDTEYQLLLHLMQHPNRSHPVDRLFEAIWKEPYFYGANHTVIVHIRNLRTKIEQDPQKPVNILTVWGKGYQFHTQVKP